jgi:peptide/nickel transport system substrate-binding protein
MVRGYEQSAVSNFVAGALFAACLLSAATACREVQRPVERAGATDTLRVGFGLTTGSDPAVGARQAVDIMTREGLVVFSRDGLPHARLADRWESSPDRLTWRVHLRPDVLFHDGQRLTADLVKGMLEQQLSDYMGSSADDISETRIVDPQTIEFRLRRPSSFLLEALDLPIQAPGSDAGAGPFKVKSSSDGLVELEANRTYYAGAPQLGAITMRSYASIRSAWADLLRGDLDMLYEVGVDALDSLRPSKGVEIYVHQRNYAYLVLLNVRRPAFADSRLRRRLNDAIDRTALVSQGLDGHASVVETVVSADHWASDSAAPHFRYQPVAIASPQEGLTINLLYSDQSHERLALMIQRQLQAVGVQVALQLVPLDQALARVRSGDFDGWLVDMVQGPTLLRSYWFWHSSGWMNWGGYRNAEVDAALDSVRHAASDPEYKAGVARFQRAIFDDPPAIFLAWSERARAVSTRFEVPDEPGRDILGSLRLWRPAGMDRDTSEH